MSWQEKIERYQAEERQKQQEAIQLERKRKLEIAREKIPPLLEVLERLSCKELLLQMRDEIWKLGEVIVSPNLDSITSETPIEASVSLIAKWPFYRRGYLDTYFDGSNWVPPAIEVRGHHLSIKAVYRESQNGILIKVDSSADVWSIPGHLSLPIKKSLERPFSFCTDEPNPRFMLENLLISDILIRQEVGKTIGEKSNELPYDKLKQEDETLVIEAIINKGLVPPEGLEYLLELVEKKQQEAHEAKGGFWEKLFGKR